jgi:hypothetical protein
MPLSYLKAHLPYLKEHYGDIASVIGLVVTFFGFVATIMNVRKAKRAAEEARQAARDVVARIGAQLLGNEIGIAVELVRQTDAMCREKSWTAAIYRCDEARIRLAQLIENSELQAVERDSTRSAFDDLGLILADLQKLRDAPERRAAVPRTTRRLHKIIMDLSRIKGRLQSDALEL